MAKHTDSNIDIDTYSWAELMALAVGDATYSAVLEEAKIDASTAIPASQISAKVGALYGNTVGVILEEVWTKARAASGGPSTAYELDWTAEGTQTITSDTTWAVDGKTWTSANQAQSTTFSVTNGQGLNITATAGGSRTWTSSAQTAPGFHALLSDLAPTAADPTKDIWVWTHITNYDVPVSTNTIIAGLWAAATGSYSAAMHGLGLINSGGNYYPVSQRQTSFTNVTGLGSISQDVLVWRLTAAGTVRQYVGTWSGGWPAVADLVDAGADLQPSGTATPTNTQLIRSNVRLVYSPAPRTTTGAPLVQVAHTRIQVGP